MTDARTSLLLAAVPLVGAAIGLAWRGDPAAARRWLLLVALATGGVVAWAGTAGYVRGSDFVMAGLLAVGAFAVLLGQPARPGTAAPLLWTAALLAAGVGAAAGDSWPPAARLGVPLGLVASLLFAYRSEAARDPRPAIATAAIGALACLVAGSLPPPASAIALLVAAGTALPLFPLHAAYLGALTVLPGGLAAFVALLLPVVGFQGLAAILPGLPAGSASALEALALAGMAVGSFGALAAPRATAVVAYGTVAFLAIPWWFLAAGQLASGPAAVFAGAAALAASGMLLALGIGQARSVGGGGRHAGGLAAAMPRFGVAFSLLAVAAMGLPPFGVFGGLLGMLLAPDLGWPGGIVAILLTWLAASWYLFDLAQASLFSGKAAPPPGDARPAELAALYIVVAVLAILGVVPAGRLAG